MTIKPEDGLVATTKQLQRQICPAYKLVCSARWNDTNFHQTRVNEWLWNNTWISAHAVGKKAKRLTKISPIVRLSRVNIKPMATMAPININNLRRRNINWKSALNCFLPKDTICSFRCNQNQLVKSYLHKQNRCFHSEIIFLSLNTNLQDNHDSYYHKPGQSINLKGKCMSENSSIYYQFIFCHLFLGLGLWQMRAWYLEWEWTLYPTNYFF